MKCEMEADEANRRDSSVGDVALEARAAALVRGALVPGEPDAACLARIRERVRPRSKNRRRSHLVLRLAMVGLVLVAGVATVKAYELARRAGWFGLARTEVLSPPSSSRPSTKTTRTAAASLPAPAEDGVAAQGEQPVVAEPETASAAAKPALEAQAGPVANDTPRRRTLPSRRVALSDPARKVASPAVEAAARRTSPELPAPAPATSEEIKSLDRALGLLRRDRNAAAALSALDAYLARYPRGVLNQEARLARIDALLMLHRTDDALAAIEPLPLDGGRRMTELRVVRGELRARSNCASAVEDFSVALARSPDAALLERILYGRGACRVQLGNVTGATSDLRRYVERFADGPHARWARSWLEANFKANGG